MDYRKSGSQQRVDSPFRVVDSPEEDGMEGPGDSLGGGSGEEKFSCICPYPYPCSRSRSRSNSYSSVSSSPFMSISTRRLGSDATDCSVSPSPPELDSEESFFESSSTGSVPTFPTYLDSESGRSHLSVDTIREEDASSQEIWTEDFSPDASERPLEELLSRNLTMNGIVLRNLNDLISAYSGDLLVELIKLDLKQMVADFFGIYSREYYERNLPLICSFLSVLFELSFSENKLKGLSLRLWVFFECILEEVLRVFNIKESHELPHIPVVYWMVDSWNRYNMFLAFEEDQMHYEKLIKNKLVGILFSLHLGGDESVPSSISDYYFRLLIDYEHNDALQGCVLYVMKSTKFLLNHLLVPRDEEGTCRANYKGIVEMLGNFGKNRTQIFSRALETLISNSGASLDLEHDQNEAYSSPIPIYLFSAFFLIEYPKQKNVHTQILLDIIRSVCSTNSLTFEHKKQSIVHITHLVLHACKNTSLGGSIDMPTLDLLFGIFDLQVLTYLEETRLFETFSLLDDVIRDLTERVRLADLAKDECVAISGLYRLQSLLLVNGDGCFGFKNQGKGRGGCFGESRVYLSHDDWRSRLVEVYLASSEEERGIRNIGNTCYLNSIIQCLALSYYFLEWLNEYVSRGSSSPQPSRLICYLFESLSCLLDSAGEGGRHSVSGRGISGCKYPGSVDLRLIKEVSSQFALGKQHDACEFLRYLLADVEEVCSPFVMTTEDCVECLFCGMVESKKSKSLSIIDLNVFSSSSNHSESASREGLNLGNAHSTSLESLIEGYFSAEQISVSMECSSCKRRASFRAWTSIKNPPKYVVLAIHNYYWDRDLNKAVKQAQLKIELDEFFLLKDRKYVIYALIFHQGGSTCSGHYFALGRKHFYNTIKQKNPDWFKYNDAVVSKVESFLKVQKSNENPFLIFAMLVD